MNRFYLLFKRLQLNVPENTKVLLSKNMSKIYYLKNQKEKIIENLDLSISAELQKFLNCEIICENYNDWYRIIIHVNLEQFSKIACSPYKLSARKEFFKIIKRCAMKQNKNYELHMNINMKEDLLRSRESHKSIRIKKDKHDLLNDLDLSKWILYREKRAKARYRAYKDTYRLDRHLINYTKGDISESKTAKDITIKGGLLVDRYDCYWIKSFLQTIIHCPRKYPPPPPIPDKMSRSKSTLVICKSVMCNYWNDQIADIDPNKKVIKINSKADHNNVTYDDIIKSDFVIASIDYIKSKNYQKTWEEYVIDDHTSLQDAYDMILRDNIANKKFNSQTNPIFSLIHWGRFIVDNESFCTEGNNIKEIFGTIRSSYRWLNISDTDINTNDSYMYLSFLSNSKIDSPLYDEDDHIYLFKNIIRPINFNNSQINRPKQKINLIDMSPIIHTIDSLCKDDIFKTTSLVNKILSNRLCKSDLKNVIKTKSLYSSTVISDLLSTRSCNICKEDKDEKHLIITSCGHVYCAECIIENLRYTTKCAMCRTSVDIENIYPLRYSSNTDKYDQIIKNIKAGKKALLYVSDKDIISYLRYLLEDTEITYDICEGSKLKKIKIVNRFNKSQKDLLIIDIKDNELSRNIKSITDIFFANVNRNVIKNQHMYCGYDYINGRTNNVNVQYYLYKDSVEHSLVC